MTDYDPNDQTTTTWPGTGTTARVEAENVAAEARTAAAEVKETATEAAHETWDEAKYTAQSTYEETRHQARTLFEESKGELSTQLGTQQHRLAGTLNTLAGELDSMAGGSAEQGMATDLARRAAGVVHDTGGWLDSHDPEDLFTEVSGFARRRPVAFLAVAAGIGFFAGRAARAVKDDDDAPQSEAHSSRRAPAHTADTTGSSGRYATPVVTFDSPVPDHPGADPSTGDLPGMPLAPHHEPERVQR